MNIRTDLAIEQREIAGEAKGIETENLTVGAAQITRIKVSGPEGEQAIGRKSGTYVTVEVPPFSDDGGYDPDLVSAVKSELARLLPEDGPVLVAGLGNLEITPDAIGPKTVDGVLATRHITGEIARAAGLENLRPVAAISPGVLGQTGIETCEIISGVAERIHPTAIIAVDALASRRLSRLGRTIQMSDTGISPGSGVGNTRAEISRETVGIPVIAMGVPTVVDAATLIHDLTGGQAEAEPESAGMIVTPREIDLLIDRAAALISHSINCALQPEVPPEDLLAMTN